MKQLYALFVCVLTISVSSVVAQPYVNSFPWTEDFEGLNNCSGSCAASCPNIGDFTQDGSRNWIVDNGGTGSSNTGPSIDHNPGTSAGKYIYSEASFPCYSGSNDWIAESPYFDMTNTNGGYELTFWWHMYGQSMGTAHFDVKANPSASWTLDVIPSWTTNNDEWEEEIVNLTSYAGNDSVQFRIRYEDPSNFYGDFAIDDFSLALLLADDAGVTSILSPQNPFCGNDTQMVIEIRNFGTNNLTSATINHTVGGVAGPALSWTGNLATGDRDTITISTATITPGTSIDAATSMPNNVVDLAPSNDESAETYFSGLAGIYDIPGDIASFEDAVDSMIAIGICDSVIFNVAAGSYNEQITIPEILGAGPTASITFQGATGTPGDVSLNFDPSSNFNQDGVVKLEGTDYIHFKDMTIDNTSNTFSYGRVVYMVDGTRNTSFINCSLNGSPFNSTTINNVVVQMEGDYANNIFEDNQITNGSYGIRAFGNSANHCTNLQINNNLIDSTYFYATYIYYTDTVSISHNEMISDKPYTSQRGVFMVDCDKMVDVDHNRIHNDPSNGGAHYYAMYFSGCDGSLNNRLNVSNNCITVGNPNYTSFSYTFYMVNSGIMDVHNNTINRMTSPNATSGYVHYISGGGLISEKNNSFYTNGGAYVRYVTSTYSMIESENNNYYNNGNSTFLFLNGQHQSVEDFASETGFDQNSVSTNPMFTDSSLCTTCNDTLDGGGTPVNLVDDLNGEIRSLTTPDIGAIEYIATANYTLGDDTTVCGSSFLLESGPAQSVLWTINSTPNSNPNVMLNASGSQPETFAVEIDLQTACGQADDDMIVTLIPNASLDSNQHICAGETATLDPGGGTSATYMWNDGSTDPTLEVDQPGTYSVTKTDGDCVSDAMIVVTQSTAVELLDAEVCSENLPFLMDATIPDGISYAWSGGTATTSAQNTFNDGNTYSVTATDAFGCVSSDDFQLTVLEEPVPAIVETHNGLVYFFDASSSLYVTPSSIITWDFGDGTMGTGLTDTVVYSWTNPSNPTPYTVTLTIDNGCGNEFTTIDIAPSVGINDVEYGAFSVYPNPAQSVLNLQLTNAFGSQGSVEFIDISGRVVQTETLNAASDFAQFDVSELASGTYTIKITGDEQVLVNRVTIE